MNIASYVDLSNKLKDQLKDSHFNYIIYDLESLSFHNLNIIEDSVKRKNFTIVLDEKYTDSPLNFPSIYYCNSLQELEQIITFVASNESLFLDNNDESDLISLITTE